MWLRPIDTLFHILRIKASYPEALDENLFAFMNIHGRAETCSMLLYIATSKKDEEFYVSVPMEREIWE